MWILLEVPESTQWHTRVKLKQLRAGAIYFVRQKFCFLWRGGRNFGPGYGTTSVTRSICRIGPVVGIGLPVGSTLVASPTCEPQHYKTNKITFTPHEDSGQPGHPLSQWVAEDPMFLHADSEDSDQTGWMSRLIWVFVGRKGHFVGLVVRWFI